MKKQYLFSLFAAVVMLTSCSSDREYSEDMKPVPGDIVPASPVFSASFDDDTRASLVGNDVKWDANDKIMVFLKRSVCDYYVLAKGAGTANGLFKPVYEVEAHDAEIPHFVAVYPASDIMKLEKTEKGYILRNVEFDYIQHVNNSAERGTKSNLMVAFSKDTDIKFKNMTGILRLTLKNDTDNPLNIYNIKVTSNSENYCAGYGDIHIDNVEGETKYSVVFDPSNAQKFISLQTQYSQYSIDKGSTAVFNIFLPPTDYEKGLNIEFNSNWGSLWNINTKRCKIERNKILQMPVLNISKLNANAVVDRETHTITCKKPGGISFDHIVKAVGSSKKLVVKGDINAFDLKNISEFASHNPPVLRPRLESLDLSDATIKKSDYVYAEYNRKKYKIEKDNVFPSILFKESDLTSVVLPKNLEEIQYRAFSKSKLKKIEIPENVTLIAGNAFECSENLSEVTFKGNHIEKLQSYAFHNCTSLRTLEIPTSVKEIGDNCFANTALEELVIPEGITELGSYIISECKDLKLFTLKSYDKKVLNDGQKYLGDEDHTQCELRLDSRCEKCMFFESFTFLNVKWKSFNRLDGTPYLAVDAATHTITINSENVFTHGVIFTESLKKALGDGDFIKIVGPTTPDDLTRASEFSQVSKLRRADFSKANVWGNKLLNTIFKDSKLESIILPNNISDIAAYAFDNCKIKSITIPASVTTTNVDIFRDCKQLTYIELRCKKNDGINQKMFESLNSENCDLVLHSSFANDVKENTFMNKTWKSIKIGVNQGVDIGGINDKDVF